MRKMLLGFVSLMIALSTSLHAEVPTQESVTKLYVATFNRAPDAAGLNYWVNDAGLSLEGIAQSFFDQSETQAAYPAGSTNIEFVEAVYANLFNREPEAAGIAYWVAELDAGRIEKSVFIQAVISGAQDTEEFGNDATILTNKTTVGLAFVNADLDDVELAKEIMNDITDDYSTVETAILILDDISDDIIDTVDFVSLLGGKTLYTTIYDEIGTIESWTFNDDLTASAWVELVGGDAQGTGTLSVDGMTMTYTCTYDSDVECEVNSTTIEVKEILADYLVVEVSGGELGSEIEILRLYFDVTKAEAYYDSLQPEPSTLSDLLAGKTVYIPFSDEGGDNIGIWEFSADGTEITVTEESTFTESISFDGNIIKVDNNDGTFTTIEATNIAADFIDVTFTDGEVEYLTLYFDRADAEAEFGL